MSREHEDAAEDPLAGIDLHVWRVPPPLAFDRASLLVRALSPAASPRKRPGIAWVLAASVLVNAAIALLLVILLARPAATPARVVVQPAGGGSIDARVGDLLARLEHEQRELEAKLAELRELRGLVLELSERVRACEDQHARTVPKHRSDRSTDVNPLDRVDPAADRCDEVSCVLTNFGGACCAKFREPRPIAKPPTDPAPELLDRPSIMTGMASVKASVRACADRSAAKGTVKIRVHVEPDGHVSNVAVESAPDAELGACVQLIVSKAIFPRTHQGGAFSYPLVF